MKKVDFMNRFQNSPILRPHFPGISRQCGVTLVIVAALMVPMDAGAMRRAIGTPLISDPNCQIIINPNTASGEMISSLEDGMTGKLLAATGMQPKGMALGIAMGTVLGAQMRGHQVACPSPPPQAAYPTPAQMANGVSPASANAQRAVDWYQPSSNSYYGRERRGPLISAPAPISRPAQVPRDSYVGYAYRLQPMMQQGQVPIVAIPVYPGTAPQAAPVLPR